MSSVVFFKSDGQFPSHTAVISMLNFTSQFLIWTPIQSEGQTDKVKNREKQHILTAAFNYGITPVCVKFTFGTKCK